MVENSGGGSSICALLLYLSIILTHSCVYKYVYVSLALSIFLVLKKNGHYPLSPCSSPLCVVKWKILPRYSPNPDLLFFSAACRGCVTLAERITSEHSSRWGGVCCFADSILSIASRFLPVAPVFGFGFWRWCLSSGIVRRLEFIWSNVAISAVPTAWQFSAWQPSVTYRIHRRFCVPSAGLFIGHAKSAH